LNKVKLETDMGHHFSFPSIKHLEHAVTSTVNSGVESAIKDISKSISFVASNMPVNTFLHLPFMGDIMAWTEGDVVSRLAATLNDYSRMGGPYRFRVGGIVSCWEKTFGNVDSRAYRFFEDYVHRLATTFDGHAVNFAILVAAPKVRANFLLRISPDWRYYGIPATARRAAVMPNLSPFTKFFMEELKNAETLVADLIPLWANLGKCKAPEAYFKHLLLSVFF